MARRLSRAFRRWAPWGLAALVCALLLRQVHTIDWHEVARALARQPRGELLAAAALAAASHSIFASYDFIGRHMTAHRLPARTTWRIAAICYAFNLNFGSLVGALALKLRLYGRAGLKPAQVGRVIGYSVITNWLGYLLVGGGALLLAPPQAVVPMAAQRGLGAAMVMLGLCWMMWCWRSPRRRWSVRGVTFELPGGDVALWQATVASANWLVMGTIVWYLLGRQADYAAVLVVLLTGAMAGVATHVPAGLGVLEAVFISAFAGVIAPAPLLAALLAYRATYYLLPLAIAATAYVWSETRSSRQVVGRPTDAR